MRRRFDVSSQSRNLLTLALLFICMTAEAQLTSDPDVNVSRQPGDQIECAIAKNPADHAQLFLLCNEVGSPGLFAARSIDDGRTWIYPRPNKTIADGVSGPEPSAGCDPSLAWDKFGNLFVAYLDPRGAHVITLLSTDGGVTFRTLDSFAGSVDQPKIVVGNGAVWVVWNQYGSMAARGTAVTGLGNVGAFNPIQMIPGTKGCSFGDIAISPGGKVVQVCQEITPDQGPVAILVTTDPDGLGPANFGQALAVTRTGVGGFDQIPAQRHRCVDANTGLAYDLNPASPHYGRLYLVYTDEVPDESDDFDIMVRTSDDDGATWSGPTRVNDDATKRSQFFPKIASDPATGNIAICWADCRNSATNTAIEQFCTIATPAGFPAFISANKPVSDVSSISSGTPNSNATLNELGDYSGITYLGDAHPAWGDTSNSTGDNPNGTWNVDAYTDVVSASAAAGSEGDPHITTVNGVHYDFQGAGEFIALRGEGVEIQIRQLPVATTFFPSPDPHDGLATCVSVNTAIAARAGTHRVTWIGAGDPNGPVLRVDGTIRTLGPTGITLAGGGRITKTAIGNGIAIEFPDGTLLFATAVFWNGQGVWYMNVDVERTGSTEGLMGTIPQGSWLPALPDGSSMGPMPASSGQRYADLYHRFADAWRVDSHDTLFDYEPGTSTETFTYKGWPSDQGPCVVPEHKPAAPLDQPTAKEICSGVRGASANHDCVFDVSVTGERGFATLYLASPAIRAGATSTTIRRSTSLWEPPVVTFTAVVSRQLSGGPTPTGSVQFMVNGQRLKDAVPLKDGRATLPPLSPRLLKKGKYTVSARYVPAKGSPYLASGSEEITEVVKEKTR